jgi:competence protein ComEA
MNQLKSITLMLLAMLFLAGPIMAKQTDPASPQAPIDLNQATAEQLAQVPYVGPKRAELIIARRQQQPFASVDELLDVQGIGPKTLEKIRPHVAVKPSSQKHP